MSKASEIYKVNKLSICFYVIVGNFFLLTMIVPSTYRGFRLLATLLLMGYCIAISPRMTIVVNSVWVTLAIYLIVALISFVCGIIKSAPGVFINFRPYFLWPVIFAIISKIIDSKYKIIGITKIILTIEFIICIIDIWYCLNQLGIISYYSTFLSKIQMGFNFNPNMLTVRFSTQHVCTHIFMVPFTMALVKNNYFSGIKNRKLLLLFILEIIAVYFSGRIALWGSCVVSLFILLILDLHQKSKSIYFLRGILLFVFLGCCFCFIINYYSDVALNAFHAFKNKIINSFTYNSTIESVRRLQQDALIKGWKESPLFGHGLGSYTQECIRNVGSPWEYEATYHYLLFQGGIVGFLTILLFMGSILISLFKTYRIDQSTYEQTIPFFLGMLSILISAYVDPYLFKLGTMWMIFIPFSIAAFFESKREH